MEGNIVNYITQIRGVSYKPSDLHDSLNENSIILLRANNIDEGKINFEDVVYVDKSKVSETQILRENDILICASSGSKNLVGKAASFNGNIECTFGAFCKVIRPRNILGSYLSAFFQSKYYRFHISQFANGANINNIKNEHINSFSIPERSFEEQKEISYKVSSLNRIIESYNRELDLLDELIKARFVEMFGTIYDKKFDMKTLPDIVSSDKNSIKRGPFGGALKKEDFLEDGYMVYEQRHAIHEDFEYAKYYVSPEKYESMIGFKVVPGDLIISCSGTLGRIAEVPMGAKEGIINQALLKISLNKDIMNNQFFIYQFRCKEIQDMLFGISRGSGIANMPSMNEVKAFKFICPPLELQNQFASFVQEIDKSRLLSNHSLLLLKSIIF